MILIIIIFLNLNIENDVTMFCKLILLYGLKCMLIYDDVRKRVVHLVVEWRRDGEMRDML